MNDFWYFIGLLLPTLLGIVSLYVAIRKAPFEIKETQAGTKKTEAETLAANVEATKNYQEIAGKASEENLTLRNDISVLRKEIDTMKQENLHEMQEMKGCYEQECSSMRELLTKAQDEIRLYRNWAERLIYQLKSIDPGIEPVPLEQKKFN